MFGALAAEGAFYMALKQAVDEADKIMRESPLRVPLDENWMRVAPGTDAAIWRPWSRETGEL